MLAAWCKLHQQQQQQQQGEEDQESHKLERGMWSGLGMCGCSMHQVQRLATCIFQRESAGGGMVSESNKPCM